MFNHQGRIAKQRSKSIIDPIVNSIHYKPPDPDYKKVSWHTAVNISAKISKTTLEGEKYYAMKVPSIRRNLLQLSQIWRAYETAPSVRLKQGRIGSRSRRRITYIPTQPITSTA